MKRDISEARNPDLRNALTAMKRAADMARKIAIDTDTGIIVVRDGKPCVFLPSNCVKEILCSANWISSGQKRQAKLLQKCIMLIRRLSHPLVDIDQ
jgi:hypothetical protein